MAQDAPLLIDESRLAHVLQVGRKAQSLAEDLFQWTPPQNEQMFLLGFLHDCGYEFAFEQTWHEEVGGSLLKSVNYLHWQEVYWHGNPRAEYESVPLLLLNLADLTTNAAGEEVTVVERIADIVARYGEGSEQVVNARALVEVVRRQLAGSVGVPAGAGEKLREELLAGMG